MGERARCLGRSAYFASLGGGVPSAVIESRLLFSVRSLTQYALRNTIQGPSFQPPLPDGGLFSTKLAVMSLQSQYDVVIIGSGAGGGTVADVVSRETDPDTDILSRPAQIH